MERLRYGERLRIVVKYSKGQPFPNPVSTGEGDKFRDGRYGWRVGEVVEDVVEEFEEFVFSEKESSRQPWKPRLAHQFVAILPDQSKRIEPLPGMGSTEGGQVDGDHVLS